ncbi:MAG TPA: RNA-binding domain-containing protein [Candidatus Methanofastidiosa archaeon]|nr:RNA-binding domain-containing protein [Candidatus Methanofastidiosa archaeon]HPR40981.1 RNA-binding domain-containing protein [Candidatus Methanofastidiosa archaeon]
MKRLVERIEIETFSHATESLEKVLGTISKMGVPRESIQIEHTNGHYGNEILILRVDIKDEDDIKAFFGSTLFLSIRSEIFDTLPERVDDRGFLYFRMDKQDLFNDVYRLHDRGDIRIFVKILAFPSNRKKVIENAKQLFGD